MARRQLGAAESNSKDAATKGYVDSAVQNGIGTYTDPASNLVVDPSFDLWSGTAFTAWNTFWNGGTAAAATQTNGPGTDAVDVNALKVVLGAASSVRRVGCTPFAVTPGQRYEIQVWARGSGVAPMLAIDVLYNTLSTNVDYFQSGVGDTAVLAAFAVTSTWTIYTGYWTCPSGAAYARLYLALLNGASGVSGDFVEVDRTAMRLAQAPTIFNGVPSGGATAAVLAKASASDQDLVWTPSASAGTPSTQMLRDAAGRAQVVDPSAAQDIATKNYVDGVVHAVTANYTASNRDIVLADASSGPITITIPIAAGMQVTVKKMDGTTNAVTVAPASGTIDGDASAVITGVDTSAVFIGDGTNAYVESVYEVSPSTTAITPTVITDWNSANTPGDYYGASASNGPATATYIGTVYQGVGADTALVQIVYRLSTLDAPEEWMRQWSSTGGWRSWKRIYDDTGTITSGALTAASGATVSSYTLRRVGKLVEIYAVLTTPAITVGTSGNITNTNLATITDTRFVPSMNVALASGASGDIAAFLVTSSGIIQVTAYPPGHANVTAGTTVSCGGSYIAAN